MVTDSDPKNGMFWALFQYIQGSNSEGLKIDMTTPVTTQVTNGGVENSLTYEMCFYIGAAHQESTPEPTDERVYIKTEAERKIFTRKVGGWMNPEKWEREAESLKQLLTENGSSFSSESHYQVGYDAPSKMWNRRNEVWFYSLE